ncbi:MAG: DUF3822 family protein [Saprospiraceae bacterium]|nr:DUF3822 family protein [Saprospiraceae bacterium]
MTRMAGITEWANLRDKQGNKIVINSDFYFRLNGDTSNQEKILNTGANGIAVVRTLQKIPYQLVFILRPQDLSDGFQESQIKHLAEYLPEIIERLPDTVAPQLCLFVLSNKLMVYLTRFNELQWVRLHSFETTDDILYHALSALKHAEQDKNLVQLMLTGEITSDSAVYLHLCRYFSQIKCCPISLSDL